MKIHTSLTGALRWHRELRPLVLVLVLMLPGGITPSTQPFWAPTPTQDQSAAATTELFGQLPLYFVENQGQVSDEVVYYIEGTDKTIYFTPDGVTFALTSPVTRTMPSDPFPLSDGFVPADLRTRHEQKPGNIQRWAVKLDFLGADKVKPVG